MTPAQIIKTALGDGVRITIGYTGKIKLAGEEQAVASYLPVVKDFRDELILHLGSTLLGGESKPTIVNNELQIPGNCNGKYKWWAGGQSVFDTLLELEAPAHIIERYIDPIFTGKAWERWQQQGDKSTS